jgi:hypothetical protein
VRHKQASKALLAQSSIYYQYIRLVSGTHPVFKEGAQIISMHMRNLTLLAILASGLTKLVQKGTDYSSSCSNHGYQPT